LTATISGFVNGETESVLGGAPALSTGATAGSPAGSYTITASPGTLSAINYDFTFVNGTLTVTRAMLTVAADNKSKLYGAPLPALTAAISGFVNGETESVLGGSLQITTTATANSNAGTYPITPGGLTATNYEINFVAGTLTITKALLTVTADNKTKVFGAALPQLTATISGFVNGETESVLGGAPALSTGATASSPVGNYPITALPGTLSAINYDFTFVNGTLTVTRADQTITFAPISDKTFGDVPFAVNATASSGLPVSLQILSGPGSIIGNIVTITGAGTIVIKAEQAGNENFNAAPSVNQTLIVNKAASTVALSSSANPSTFGQSVIFTAQVSGPAGTALPRGTVIFKDGATVIGAVVLSATGQATTTIATLSVGTHSVTAEYSGDSNFNPGASVALTQTVGRIATTITGVNTSASYSDSDQQVTMTATVISGPTSSVLRLTSDVGAPSESRTSDVGQMTSSGVNQGTVTVTVKNSNGTVIGAPSSSATVVNGNATMIWVLPGGTLPGSYTIEYSYSGTGELGSSSDTKVLTVNQAATITSAADKSANYSDNDQTVMLTATVSGSVVNEGSVTFTVRSSAGNAIGSPVTSAPLTNGAASASYSLPGGTLPGNYRVEASYSGSVKFSASSDTSKSLTVNKAPTTITVKNKQVFFATNEQVVALTATVSGSTVNEGTVTLQVLDGITAIGSAVTVAVTNGTATASYRLPANTAIKSYTIAGSYSGGVKFAASSGSGALEVRADTAPPQITIGSPTVGQLVTGTITVTGTVTDAESGVATVVIRGVSSDGNGGERISTVVATINGNQYTGILTEINDGLLDITATGKDKAGNERSASVRVKVDANGPTIRLVAPVGGFTREGDPIPGVLFAGVTNRLTVRIADSFSGIDPASVQINGTMATDNRDGTFSAELNNLAIGQMNIVIIARDRAGNMGTGTAAFRVLAYGDVNGDGAVNLDDLLMMLQVLSGREPLAAAPGGDLSRDGVVSTTDLVALLQVLLGMFLPGAFLR